MHRKNLWVVFLIFALGLATFAQEANPPGGIKMLPGYQHRPKQGVDSFTGTIGKPGGLQIEYDIGEMAGNYTECTSCGWIKGEVWRKKQIVNGQDVVCVWTNKKRLVVSYPASHANFVATILTKDQLTDMLLIVLTFQPSKAVGRGL